MGVKRWQEVKSRLDKSNINYSFSQSEYHMHAIELVKIQAESGIKNFIGIGGDGTLNELLNGILQAGFNVEEFTIGLMPIGTGNDWVRSHPSVLNLDKVIQKLSKPTFVKHDIGLIKFSNEKSEIGFMNVAGCGLDGQVVEEIEHLSAANKKGKRAYIQGLLTALRTYESSKQSLVVEGTNWMNENLLVVTAALGRYFGNGMLISPNAVCNRRKLDFTAVTKVSNWIVFPQLFKLFNGKIASASFVEKRLGQQLRVTSNVPLPIQADGEFIGRSKTIEFGLHPQQINVLG